MDQVDDSLHKPATKQPVVRGARACTVCRAAKMKCVGAEDGQKQCQRCKRAGVECVFEKHRRGRKPGSKLSEASKMLRKLEKGLTSAKMKSQAAHVSFSSPYPVSDSRSGASGDGQYRIGEHFNHPFGPPGAHHYTGPELPPLHIPHHGSSGPNGHIRHGRGSPSMDMDDDEDDEDGENAEEGGMYPAKLIGRESQRNSFFGTVLGPSGSSTSSGHRLGTSSSSHSDRASHTPGGVHQAWSSSVHTPPTDPIIAGLMDEETAKMLFDLIFLRLNPFVNLFDPELHTVSYVRKKSPFLFSTLLMAGSKFWKPEIYSQCYKLAHDLAIKAFAESAKGVEVVQAFACLMYWKEPDDMRTWMYIGYACRMAVELGLNRYLTRPPDNETTLQRLERRNRERTYLVLFIHDKSLSMQTARQWMLPEDDLTKNSTTWHEQVPHGIPIRPEDVIVSAFVALRKIAGETTDLFSLHKGASGPPSNGDANYEVLLRGCNAKLTQWSTTWEHEMKKANGHMFHFSFLQFFRLYVRLFLNSFGIHNSISGARGASPSLQALSQCYASATESLRIVTSEFARVQVLQYGQDSITIMTAYASVFLLKLLRNPSTMSQLCESVTEEVYTLISRTAGAYQEAAAMASSSTSSAYHARFLRSLLAKDKETRARHAERERRENLAIDPILQGDRLNYRASSSRTVSSSDAGSGTTLSNGHSPTAVYYPHPMSVATAHSFPFPASPHLPSHPLALSPEHPSESMHNSAQYTNQQMIHPLPPQTESDAHYWRNMFRELGFGSGVEASSNHGSDGEYGGSGNMYPAATEFSYQTVGN